MILLTGANGHLGANLLRRLLADGAAVRVLLRPDSDNSTVDGLNVERAFADLRDPVSLTAATKGATTIYHCAAQVSTVSDGEQQIFVNNVLGTKFRMITGYPGGNDVSLAMERGEVGGRCGWSWSSVKSIRASWLTEKKLNLLMQFSLAKHADLPHVPLIMDLARSDVERQMFRLIFARQTMGRPYQGPPGVPADRLGALQQAFMETMKDKDFLAEADKAQFEITPVSGEAIEKLVAEAHKTPPEVAQKAGQLVK